MSEDDFARVIDDTRLKYADEEYTNNVKMTSDPYVGVELAIQRGADGDTVHAKVGKLVRDHDEMPIGTAHSNPLLDSHKYKVEYVDGHVEELTANVIAKKSLRKSTRKVRQMMVSAIVDHRVLHDAISKSQGTYVNLYGVKQCKTTTHGWELLVKWRDGLTDWVALKDLKDSFPMELAIHAKEWKVDATN